MLDGLLNIKASILKSIDTLSWCKVSPVRPQGQVMVLIVLSDARQIFHDIDADFLENLGIANT